MYIYEKKNMFILHTEEKLSQKRNMFQPIKRLSSYPPTLTIVIFFLSKLLNIMNSHCTTIAKQQALLIFLFFQPIIFNFRENEILYFIIIGGVSSITHRPYLFQSPLIFISPIFSAHHHFCGRCFILFGAKIKLIVAKMFQSSSIIIYMHVES